MDFEDKSQKINGFVNLNNCNLSFFERLKNPKLFKKAPAYDHCIAQVEAINDDDIMECEKEENDKKQHIIAPRFKVIAIKGVQEDGYVCTDDLNFTGGQDLQPLSAAT